MDDILKSEIFIVVYEKKDGVSFEEFGGLFRQVHGYYLNLSKYGYPSLRSLLNDMKDLVEIKMTKGHHMIRCKSPSRHHVVVSHGNNSLQGNEQVPGLTSGLPSSAPSPDPVVRKTEQAQPTENHVKQVNSTNSATGKTSKEKTKPTSSTPAKNTNPTVNHMNCPQPVKCGLFSNEKTATNNKTTHSHVISQQVNNTNVAAGKTSKEKPGPKGSTPDPALIHKNSPELVNSSNEKTATKSKTTHSHVISQQVNNANAATGKTSQEKPNPKCSTPAKNTDPALIHKNSPQLVNSSNEKTATKNKTTQSHVISQQVNNTNVAAGKTSKENPGPKCSTPAKNTDPTLIHKNSPQLVNSSNEKTATKNKTTNSHRLTELPIPKPLLASPAGNVSVAAGATRTNNVSKTRQESNSKILNPTSKPNLTHLQNNSFSAKTGAIENKVFAATSGPNKKAGLLPTPQMPVKFSPFDLNYNSQIAQLGIGPTMTYASVCSNNINNNHFNHTGQQCTPNNVRFNIDTRVNSPYVTQSHSRAEPRPSIQPSSVIKENIQVLLTEQANGLSVFQLQKMYLFKYRQPLKFRGSATLKQLLMDLKDVVKTEGVGVQMLVYPAPAENSQVTAASGDHDAALQVTDSLLTKKDSKKETVLNPHSAVSSVTQNDELQEATQFLIHHGQILACGQYQMDPMKIHITEAVKTESSQPTGQNMQRDEHISSNARHEESPKEVLSVPASYAQVLPDQINDRPQHETPQSVQMHHQMNQSHGLEEISYPCKNFVMKDTNITNGPLQMAPQDSYSHQLILHSSGFSIVMGQPIDGPRNKVSEITLADTHSVAEQKTPYHSNSMLDGPELSQQMLTYAISSVLLKDTKPHQLSNPNVEDSEHPLLPLHTSGNTMKTYVRTEFPALQQREDFQTAKNCTLTECPASHSRDNLHTGTVHVHPEKPSSVQKNNSPMRKTVEPAAYSSLNRQENAPNSHITNNINGLLNASSNEKTPDAQTENSEKTSQQEASLSPPPNGLDKGKNTPDHHVYDAEQAEYMSSHVHQVPNTHTSETKQNKSTLQTKQSDEFTSEMIHQNSLLTSRQEIADLLQNIPKEPKISDAQSELQNNLDCITDQEDENKTWQTSQEGACCIL